LEMFKNKYFKFGVAGTLYLLFVIWLHNYWYLLGLPILFDIYVSRKVNWTFWKKREGKNNAVIEWLDALIFAVVAVTLINIYLFQNYKIPTPSMESTMLVGDHLYVSKVAYGPRAPITPLAFPFAQNRMLNGESYLKWIQLDYKRLKGFGEVKRNDIVVFNFPAGDTVAVENSASSIYNIYQSEAMQLRIRDINAGRPEKDWDTYYNQGRELVKRNYTIVVRPIDRKDNYIKRCVAIPGDSLEIIHGKVYINGTPQPDFKGIQYDYLVQTNGRPLNPRALEKYDLPPSSLGIQNNPRYNMPLSEEKAKQLKDEVSDIVKVEQKERTGYNYLLFPHSSEYKWNEDNFGPIWLPEKGATVKLDRASLPFYQRIIEAYEGNELRTDGEKILINGEEVQSYTFQQDYYWMMGDNRHSSSDSRYWGYVPEDHIIGKPKFIWLSLDSNKKFLAKIRFDRLFKSVDASE
ncbi:MAG: S26 family signal peptidase, partial [Bacteroidales bacterium]|nr:S26 family signal peptidase [Bacteroidales bacterium]